MPILAYSFREVLTVYTRPVEDGLDTSRPGRRPPGLLNDSLHGDMESREKGNGVGCEIQGEKGGAVSIYRGLQPTEGMSFLRNFVSIRMH